MGSCQLHLRIDRHGRYRALAKTRRRTEVHQAASARTRLPPRKLSEAHRALGLSSCGQALQKTPIGGYKPAIETLGERKIDAVVYRMLQAQGELERSAFQLLIMVHDDDWRCLEEGKQLPRLSF